MLHKEKNGIRLLEIVFVTLFVLFVVWTIPGCSTAPKVETVPFPTAPTQNTQTPPVGVDIKLKVPSIVYGPIDSFESEMGFIMEGQAQANAVLKDPCFKDGVMVAKFTENNGLTNAQIFQKFLDASPMKVGIRMFTGGLYERLNHTVAYEGNPIRMNRRYVINATYVASTSLHEGFGHGLDFTHDRPQMNPNSIPYYLNKIFEACAKKLGFKVVYQ